ncbi:MAG TPA: 50S ribosomal protein L32 [Armatimonadota bacterium]|nr:50S ribosomal protein L32 [Armatimonadota bacterium]
MALPKRRHSRGRTRRKRAHLNLTAPNVAKCSNCEEPLMPHNACRKCGFYQGRQVLTIRERKGKQGESR